MYNRMLRYYERGQRCDTVCDLRAADLPAGSKGAQLAAAVKRLLASLAALDVQRATSASRRREGTAGRREARESLSALVESVATTAEAAAAEHPDVVGQFVIPRLNRSDATLIATARSFAGRAVAFVAPFVDYGLPGSFVGDLTDGADQLEFFISTQGGGRGAGVNANATAQAQLRELNEALERLNVIFHNKYRDNPGVLAEWESAYHVEAAPGSKRKRDGEPTPPPADE